jgi:hypothetical protein
MLTAHILAEIKLSKSGTDILECEDAFKIVNSDDILKIAISDGATESSFSKEWASILVEEITKVKNARKTILLNKLPVFRKLWLDLVSKKSLPWYAEIKLQMGAFSALLFSIINLKTSDFYCIAVGDCCAFNVRDNCISFSFPFSNPNEFNNHPFLIKSKDDNRNNLRSNIQVIQKQKIKENDILFFMSDALALWFLEENCKGGQPWNILLNLFKDEKKESFMDWLLEQQKNKLIKNDDSTLIIVELK